MKQVKNATKEKSIVQPALKSGWPIVKGAQIGESNLKIYTKKTLSKYTIMPKKTKTIALF